MFRRDHQAFRFISVLLLVAALSGVYSIHAQSTSLTQVVKTLDGQISVHVPQGWMERDAAAPLFTSVLVIGDTAASLQSAVSSLNSTQTTSIEGMSGIISIIQPSTYTGLSPAIAASSMLNAVIGSVQQAGGQILQQQSLMIGGQYPGSVAVVEVAATQAKGLVGVFQAGENVVEFTLGASPLSSFDANQQMFLDMMNSIRVPAEAGSAIAPTPALVNPVQPVVPAGQGAVTASSSGVFSARLPQGWVIQPSSVPNFGDTLVFGSDQPAAQASYNVIVLGQPLSAFQGVGGMIGVVDPKQIAGAPLDQLVAPLLGRLTGLATTAGAQTVGQPQVHTFGGQYAGQLQELNVGFVAVMHTEQQLLIAIVLGDDMNTNRAEMTGILESIRIPAESSSGQSAATPEVASATEQTFRSSDNQVSIVIPSNWTVLDHITDGSILAYGDSSDAAISRLYSVKPALATKTVISGSGGVVALYPMTQFGIDPNNPDLMPLIQTALSNLRGYTVDQPPQLLADIKGGVIAQITGTETGYLALIPFGDQIAYVTATVATSDSFDPIKSSLLEIVKSVHVPAAPEPTSAPGLGGLGGLAATPEVTPTLVPGGLGGLGELSPATPEATSTS